MGLVMTLDSKSIRFDFNKATIKPEYRDILNRIAGILMTLTGHSIAVTGYTDDIGTQTYNLQLSQRRAEAVRDFLVQTGIPRDDNHERQGFWEIRPSRSGRQRTGACCQPPGRGVGRVGRVQNLSRTALSSCRSELGGTGPV